MRFIKDLPIRRKLLLVTLATCGAALALACTALFWFESVNFRKNFAAELASLGAVIAQNSAAPLAFDDKKSAVEVLSALQVKPHITCACVYDAAGKLFAHFGVEDDSEAVGKAPPSDRVVFNDGYASLTLPIKLQDAAPGRLQLRANFKDKYRELLSLYGLVLAAVLAGSIIVILIVSAAMQGIITRPIAALAQVAHNVSEKEDYSTRAPESGRDEVGLLTRTFNRMLDQIQSRDQRLRESQQRYEVSVQGSSDGIWDWDIAGDRVYFSPRWKEIVGCADHELPNVFEEWQQRLHPEDAERVKGVLQDYLDQRSPVYEVEFRMRHKDGSYRWVLARGAALRDAAGKAIRMAGSHTDITQRKQSEIELRVSREKFETLVNSIDGVVWEADLKTSAFTFVSAQAERLLGFPRKQWLEKPTFWADQIHPEDREATLRQCAEAAAQRQVLRCEYRMTAADGRAVWIRDIATVAEAPSGALLLRGVLFDISEQKKSELEMENLNQQLREASREAGMAEVATGVLHNVGNVLNSVNVSAAVMMDQLRKSKTASLAKAVALLRQHKDDVGDFLSSDAKGKQLPAFIEAISEQLAREQAALGKELEGLQQNIDHIKQVVAMQQSYAKVSGVLENLPLHELMEDALRMASTGLVRHQIQVVRQYEPVPPALADRHKVLQILINLVSNAKHALEHRPDGRRLTLRVTRGDCERVRVEVTDNGAGIAPENLTRVFQHGFTTKKTGHGFGLHSGANAAKELGGSLLARSDGPGHGATFVLELPIGSGAAKAAAPLADSEGNDANRAA